MLTSHATQAILRALVLARKTIKSTSASDQIVVITESEAAALTLIACAVKGEELPFKPSNDDLIRQILQELTNHRLGKVTFDFLNTERPNDSKTAAS